MLSHAVSSVPLPVWSAGVGAQAVRCRWHDPKSSLPLRESAEGISMDISRTSFARRTRPRYGNILPRVSTQEVTHGLADVLRPIYAPFKSPADQLSEDSGTCTRAARNHLSGANAMNLTDFFNACRAIPELQKWGQKMMGVPDEEIQDRERNLTELVNAFVRLQGGASEP